MTQPPEDSHPTTPEPPAASPAVPPSKRIVWTPDLGADIGSRRWFLSLFLLIGLIGSAGLLGWYALQGPDTADLFPPTDQTADAGDTATTDTAATDTATPDQTSESDQTAESRPDG